MASQAFAWTQGLGGQANLVCASPVGGLAAQRSEQNTGEVTAAYTVGTPWGCTQAPSGQQTQSGAKPQAEALSSTLSTSGFRSAWAATPHLQVLQEVSWASGRPAGRSQCAPVNPGGPSGSLWVLASAPSLISLNINGLNAPIKRHRLTDWIRNRTLHFAGYRKHISGSKTNSTLE